MSFTLNYDLVFHCFRSKSILVFGIWGFPRGSDMNPVLL